MKKISIILLIALAGAACAKKGANSAPANSTSGIVTESKAGESTAKKDLAGTWIVTEKERTWELVITPTGTNTWTTTPTLLSNSEKGGLIDYGPPGSKGDTLIIVSDEPGKLRIRYAKAENFHGADFWNGTGIYDDNSFNFAGYYIGKRKS
jgi:hypothetical protein